MGKGKDKRNFPRSLIDLTVDIKTGSESLIGNIVDLTVEAISLETDRPVTTGT